MSESYTCIRCNSTLLPDLMMVWTHRLMLDSTVIPVYQHKVPEACIEALLCTNEDLQKDNDKLHSELASFYGG